MRSAIFKIPAFAVLLFLGACAAPIQSSAHHGTLPSPIYNFQIVDAGKLYRSGQPVGESDWSYLESIGVNTVLKLNQYSAEMPVREEVRLANQHGMKVIQCYMPPEDFPHNLNLWAKPDQEQLMRAVAELENETNGVMLVHCSHGKDRTGLVIALYNIRNNGLSKEAAYQQMKNYGANPWLFGMKPALMNSSLQ